LEVGSANIVEIGYGIFSDTQDSPLLIKNMLVMQESSLPPETIAVTGIDDFMLDDFGVPPKMAFDEFLLDLNRVDIEFIAGHNLIRYDWPVLLNNLRRHGYITPNLPLVDTMHDLPLEYEPKSMALYYLAADHGFIPGGKHRAIYDVLTCAKIMQTYDIKDIISNSKIPMIDIRAVVSFDNNKLAKDKGFRWNPERKIWMKIIKKNKLESEIAACPFQVVQLEK